MGNGEIGQAIEGMILPVVGLGLGLAAVNSINRTLNPPFKRGTFVVYINRTPERSFNVAAHARAFADRLRKDGFKNVQVRYFP